MAGRNLIAQQATESNTLNMAVGAVNTGTWTQIVAKTLYGCCAVEIFNPSGSTMEIAVGASGHEVALPYTILPGGSSILLGLKIPAGSRVSLQAVDADATSGYFILNQFG